MAEGERTSPWLSIFLRLPNRRVTGTEIPAGIHDALVIGHRQDREMYRSLPMGVHMCARMTARALYACGAYLADRSASKTAAGPGVVNRCGLTNPASRSQLNNSVSV